MQFRVTVTVGQDSTEGSVLEERVRALRDSVHALPGGAGAVTALDLVKATAELVLAVDAPDALTAARDALDLAGRALGGAGLPAPLSIVTVEAEAVPEPVADRALPMHPVDGA